MTITDQNKKQFGFIADEVEPVLSGGVQNTLWHCYGGSSGPRGASNTLLAASWQGRKLDSYYCWTGTVQPDLLCTWL